MTIGAVLLSVIVKALNEERRIAACLDSALAAVRGLDAEVIVVDSLSSDRTVEIARRYPVRIVQFEDARERCCGAAVEAGWRHARGRFAYVLDADMQLQPGFLEQALSYLEQHCDVAAVAGRLVDTRLLTLADRQRAQRAQAQTTPHETRELGGGGLYRAAAVAEVGYLAHRCLAAYEEAELGMRLRAQGWKLVRLPVVGVLHEGHDESNWQMLGRLWRNGRAKAGGMLLRSSIGKAWFGSAARVMAHAIAVPVLHVASLLALAVAARLSSTGTALWTWAGYWVAIIVVMAIHKRSVRLGLWHVVLWHYWAAGTLLGMRRRVGDPLAPIAAREIVSAPTRPAIHGTRDPTPH